MNFLLKVLALILLSVLPSSIFSQSNKLDSKVEFKIDSLFDLYHNDGEPGSIMSIVKKGEVVYTNQSGLANLEHHIPISNKTAFNIASVSKQFTTYLALLLEEEGKLSLNDDIRDHLIELKHLPYKITLTQLANHTHGLPNADQLAQLKGNTILDHNEVLEILLSIENVNFEPGDKFVYNNTGYILLSQIIERAGGEAFSKQVQDKIFTPLGMNNSVVVDYSDILIPNKATSYAKYGETYYTSSIKLSTIGSSGIYTTIADLERWVKNYQNPKVGKRSFYEKMENLTVLNSGIQTDYGLGLHQDEYKGLKIVFHGGGTANYRTYLIHAPEHDLSLICLSNKGGIDLLEVLYNALEFSLEDYIIVENEFDLLSSDVMKELAGYYEIFPGQYITLSLEDEMLFFSDLGSLDKHEMKQINENTFNFIHPVYTMTLTKDGFNYCIADMTYPCTKIIINSPVLSNADLEKYTGLYKNEEHNISFECKVVDDKLIAGSSNHSSDIELIPLGKNSFRSKQAYFGKIEFVEDDNAQCNGFILSGQKLANIMFQKR